jgi:hypothetical protein
MAARWRGSPAGARLRPWGGAENGVRALGGQGERNARMSKGKAGAEGRFPRSRHRRWTRPELRRAIHAEGKLTTAG